MRKTVFMLFFLIPIYVNGQARISLQSGINFANIIFKAEDNEDKKFTGSYIPRFTGGLGIEIPIDDGWFILSGLHFSGKGTKYGRATDGKKDSIRIHLNYIELPVQVSYKFPEKNNQQFALSAGIYGSYGFLGKVLYKNNPEQTRTKIHLKDNWYKRFEFGYNLSVMYELNLRYGVKLEYSNSLIDITRKKWRQNNKVLGVSFFYNLTKYLTKEDQ